VDAGTAVALLGFVAAFATGYLGARWQASWQARYERVQWRRDKLLQLCTDLLSASTEMVQIGFQREVDPSVRRPIALDNRLLYASAGIALISPELQSDAEVCEKKAKAVFDAGDTKRAEAHKAANRALGDFVTHARKVLLELHPDLDPPKPKKKTKKRSWPSLPLPGRGSKPTQDHAAPAPPISGTPSVSSGTGRTANTDGGTTPPP
jgi:hypothetical protein